MIFQILGNNTESNSIYNTLDQQNMESGRNVSKRSKTNNSKSKNMKVYKLQAEIKFLGNFS